jgi:hypothetical protein
MISFTFVTWFPKHGWHRLFGELKLEPPKLGYLKHEPPKLGCSKLEVL